MISEIIHAFSKDLNQEETINALIHAMGESNKKSITIEELHSILRMCRKTKSHDSKVELKK